MSRVDPVAGKTEENVRIESGTTRLWYFSGTVPTTGVPPLMARKPVACLTRATRMTLSDSRVGHEGTQVLSPSTKLSESEVR
jgi:hypothetical protein